MREVSILYTTGPLIRSMGHVKRIVQPGTIAPTLGSSSSWPFLPLSDVLAGEGEREREREREGDLLLPRLRDLLGLLLLRTRRA